MFDAYNDKKSDADNHKDWYDNWRLKTDRVTGLSYSKYDPLMYYPGKYNFFLQPIEHFEFQREKKNQRDETKSEYMNFIDWQTYWKKNGYPEYDAESYYPGKYLKDSMRPTKYNWNKEIRLKQPKLSTEDLMPQVKIKDLGFYDKLMNNTVRSTKDKNDAYLASVQQQKKTFDAQYKNTLDQHPTSIRYNETKSIDDALNYQYVPVLKPDTLNADTLDELSDEYSQYAYNKAQQKDWEEQHEDFVTNYNRELYNTQIQNAQERAEMLGKNYM